MKLSRTGWCLLLCLALVLGAFQANAGAIQGVTDKEIKLGVIMAQSGPIGPEGRMYAGGMLDYFKYVNETGGIHGRKIKLLVEDDQFQTPKAIAAFNKLWFRDKVFDVIALGGTAQGVALLPQAKRNNLVTLPQASSKSFIEPFNPNCFMIYNDYDDEVYAMFDYIVNDLGDKKPVVGVVYAETQFGKDCLRAARKRAEQYGVKLAAELVLPMRAVDANSQVMALKKAGVKYVINGSVASAMMTILKAFDDLRYYPYLFGIHLQTDEFLVMQETKAAEKFVGAHFVTMWNEDVPGMKLVRGEFKKNNRKRVAQQNYYTFGFATGMVFAEGLKIAGRDLTLDKLREALETLKGYTAEGILAPLTYTATDHKGPTKLRLVKTDMKKKELVPIGWRTPKKLD